MFVFLRFTQTDGSTISNLVTSRQDGTITMFEPSVQPQVYIATTLDKKDSDKSQFPVCYNVNMLQKLPVSSNQTRSTKVPLSGYDVDICF